MRKLLLVLLLLAVPSPSFAAFTHYFTFPVNGAGEVPSTLSAFPVLVKPAANSIWCTTGAGGHVANANGYDIRPYADSAHTTFYNFQLVPGTYVGSGSCTFEMWVQVSTLTSTSVIYMFYGDGALNTDGSGTGGSNPFDANYTGIWHLSAPSGTLSVNDSSQSAVSTTNDNATATTGNIDGGAAFVTGSAQSVLISSTDLIGNLSASTVSVLFKTSDTSNDGALYAEGNTGNANPLYVIDTNATGAGSLRIFHRDTAGASATVNSSTNWADGNWHLVVVSRTSSSAVELFIDNVSQGTDTPTIGTVDLDNARLGALERTSVIFYLTGSVDEVQRSKIARSADWNTATYRNQRPSSTFFSAGSETSLGGGGGGTPTRGMLLLGVPQ